MFVDRGGLSWPQDPHLTAWEVALDRIELDVIRTERVLAEDRDGSETELRTDTWDLPQGLGPLPAALADRASGILARQQHLLTTLAERLGATVAQQAVAARVERVSTRQPAGPVYVDVSA